MAYYSTEEYDDDYTGANGYTTAPPPFLPPPLFSWADYLVFAISLVIPLLMGFYFFWKSRNKQTTEEFLMGERSMNFVAVALSILASLLNGVFVIGIPAEIHYYGVRIIYQFLGLIISTAVVSHIFVVKYQQMLFTSAYQYIQWRYNTATRIIASLFFCSSVTIFLAIVLYVPALAFAQVTNLSIYITIVITGVVCTFYTTIGGMKAVVWTDALQIIVLLGGLITIAIVGAVDMGGGQEIWEIARVTGRLNWNNFNFDPRERTSFWSQVLGTAIVYIGLFISNQMTVQRYMAVKSSSRAQASLYIALGMALPLYILILIIGLVLHAYYAKCDPLIPIRGHRKIETGDQIFPLFLMELLGKYYGIPGLIMSSIFAAALSSVSAVINSLSACFLEDFIDPAVMHYTKKKLDDRKRRLIAIAVVVFFGIVTIGLSFVASKFTAKIVQASNVIWGVIGGPLAGIFIMGFLFPFCNSWGAISGMFTGLIIALWTSIGNIVHTPTPTTLPVGLCNNFSRPISFNESSDPLKDWYLISFAWYGTIGTGICLVTGILVSLITGGASSDYRKSIRPDLIYSVADNCCCCCPMACIQCYRCGVGSDDKAEQVHLESVTKLPGSQVKYGHSNTAYTGNTSDEETDNEAAQKDSPPDYDKTVQSLSLSHVHGTNGYVDDINPADYSVGYGSASNGQTLYPQIYNDDDSPPHVLL